MRSTKQIIRRVGRARSGSRKVVAPVSALVLASLAALVPAGCAPPADDKPATGSGAAADAAEKVRTEAAGPGRPAEGAEPARAAAGAGRGDGAAAAGKGAAAGKAEGEQWAPNLYRGYGIDTCEAPAVSSLRAWKNTPYRAIGVYFAGHGRACPRQHNISPRWMKDATAAGWKVLPIYLGGQSPCVKNKHKKRFAIGGDPVGQGTREGRVAVSRAGALGIAPGSPLYLDMEAYDLKKRSCTQTTLHFVQAWNREVRRFGYIAGFYSSANSGVRHMAAAQRLGEQDLPSVMWFARWKVPPSVYGEKWLPKNTWTPNRRVHQYHGHAVESHGGRKLKIDRNFVDAPVAVIK